jgi:hypothetical protein
MGMRVAETMINAPHRNGHKALCYGEGAANEVKTCALY